MINKLTREEAGRLSSMLKQIELGQDDEAARMLVSAVRERISDLYDRVWESKNGERVKEGNVEYTYNHSMDSEQFIDKTKYERFKEFQDRLDKLNSPINMINPITNRLFDNNDRGYIIESSSLVLKLVCKDGTIIYEEQKPIEKLEKDDRAW